MNFLARMMNRGFLIFKADDKYILTKIATPADPRPSITDEVQSNTSSIEFDTWEKAINKAAYLCQEGPDFMWSIQVIVGHQLGSRILELDPIRAATAKDAKSIAEKKAARFIEDNFEKGSFEKWEVKIRPFGK